MKFLLLLLVSSLAAAGLVLTPPRYALHTGRCC